MERLPGVDTARIPALSAHRPGRRERLGLLAGLADPQVGFALKLIRDDAPRQRTVGELVRGVGIAVLVRDALGGGRRLSPDRLYFAMADDSGEGGSGLVQAAGVGRRQASGLSVGQRVQYGLQPRERLLVHAIPEIGPADVGRAALTGRWPRPAPARARAFAVLLALSPISAPARAGEVCRYVGETDYSGRVAVTTDVVATPLGTRVDVLAEVRARPFWFVHMRFLMEEVSLWRAGELQRVSVNSRYLLGERIVRQTWDDFRREPDGMQARRVQAKTLADFRRRHPGFVQHWGPEAFGRPWVEDYDAAPPERRADLDLAPLPAGLRTPLALAFYWLRFAPRAALDPVFMPGFKKQRQVEVPVTAAASPDGTVVRASLRFTLMNESVDSTATAWLSAEGRLLRLEGALHGAWRSARGTMELSGCEGVPPLDR